MLIPVCLTIIALGTLAAVAGIVVLLLRRQADMEKTLLDRHAAAEHEWAAERRELLNRIQRPDVPQAAPVTDFVIPEAPPDEINMVGQVADPEPDEIDLVGTVDGEKP